ncbi:MAG: MarR family transcriptional regulator [Caulobacteraceae bacterium]|nr:MarR family transcriptional regulator [Caulobacter sp.]
MPRPKKAPPAVETAGPQGPRAPLPGLRAGATRALAPYRQSIAGTLLAARESVMTPVRPILRDAGVTEQQWRVLRVLVDEGPIETSRLATSAMLLAPSVSRILRELSARGLISRASDADDRRKFIVQITAEGRRLLEATALRTLEVIACYTAGFGSERLQRLLDELRAFSAMIHEIYRSEPSEGEGEVEADAY